MRAMNKKGNQGKKKMNSYLRLLITMMLAAIGGGILGGTMGYFEVDKWNMGFFLDILRKYQIPILLLIFVISVPLCEGVIHKLKKLHDLLEKAEDEEADLLEYEEERYGSIGTITSNFVMVLTLLSLSVTYNGTYIEEHPARMITGCVLTIIIYAYQGIWQIRYVKCIQKRYPKLQGDPGCLRMKKFQKAWIESCDEAEKELIYQSSYEAYTSVMRIIPFCAVIAMLCHLMWNTGIFAVVMVGIIWLWTNVIYCRNCVIKRRKKLNVE